MSSDAPALRLLRRWGPWLLWVAALAVALPLGRAASGFGVAPAVVEVRRVTVASPRALRIERVLVTPGQAVRAGDALVQLDAGDLDVELAIARADLQRLELEIASRTVALSDDRSESASRLAAEAERAALDVSRLAAEDERDRGELAQLDTQIDREKRLVAEKLTKSEGLDALLLRRAALARKVEQFAGTVEKARVIAASAAKRLGEWRSATGGGASAGTSHIDRQVAPVRAAVEAQRERVRQLELSRERATLVAPFHGRVGELFAREGELAAAGGPLVTVVDDRPVRAVAYVNERWAARVRVGDVAELSPSDRSGPPRAGRVEGLGASVTELPVRFRPFPTEPSFGREVYIRLDEAAPLPGQAFDATFHRAEASP